MKRTKCPYFPSCSEYGLEAVEKIWCFKRRYACWPGEYDRCNPFFKRWLWSGSL